MKNFKMHHGRKEMRRIMGKLYLVHVNTLYEGYGYYENLYGVFTDRKTAKKVKTEITLKLYEKEGEAK